MVWVVGLRPEDVGKLGHRRREEPRRVADGDIPLAPSLPDRPRRRHKLLEERDE